MSSAIVYKQASAMSELGLFLDKRIVFGYTIYRDGTIINKNNRKIKPYLFHARCKDYLKVKLEVNGKRIPVLHHRLIAACFLGDVMNKDVDHQYGNSLDNKVDNLCIMDSTFNRAIAKQKRAS
jgi:hypothetical protein